MRRQRFRVRFQGVEYWYITEEWGQWGAIAPLHHCDDDGHVTLDGLLDPAGGFAHYYPDGDRLMRHGVKIGGLRDLQPVERFS